MNRFMYIQKRRQAGEQIIKMFAFATDEDLNFIHGCGIGLSAEKYPLVEF